MEELKIDLGVRSYSVLIGSGILAGAGKILQERGIKGRLLIVTNPTVARYYLKPLQKSLSGAGYDHGVIKIPDGESYKSLRQANRIYDALVAGEYDRKATIVALGGGVIGDLAGFAAATYMRGIGFIQVPTTLLSQVDSSIGGKTAVNHPRGKNMIGAFYQPQLVISDVATFRTLPEREFASGLAEVIKHGIILDENYFRLVSGERENLLSLDPDFLTWVVAGSCVIKARVVEEDEMETGRRAILNFGHTLGHALESVTRYEVYKHGEAIAVGMVAAARIAREHGLLQDKGLPEQLAAVFASFGLPVAVPGLSVQELMAALQVDKKVEYGKLRWVLPRRLGEVVIVDDIPAALVEQVIREMGGAK
jgi:3-dehydroquinate synthase